MNKCFILLCFFSWMPIAASAEETELLNWVLLEDESRVLNVGDLPLATIDRPDLLKVIRHGNNKIKIQALKMGHTHIKFHGGNHPPISLNLTITSRKLYKQYENIRHLAQGIHGLKIGITRKEVVLEGALLLPNDVKKVELIKSQYPDLINLTEFNQDLYEEVTAKYLQHKLNAPTITVTLKDSFLILEGSVANQEEANTLIRKAKHLAAISNASLKVTNLLEVKKTVLNVHLTFMQINQNEGDKTGFNILETFKSVGNLNWSGPGTPQSSLVTNAETQINALVEKAMADVIVTPQITVNSGATNTFHEGDQIIIHGTEKNTTTKVNTGLIIQVTPVLHSNGSVDLKLSFEVSAPTTGLQGSTHITRFYIETEVTCQMGQTIVLSELLTSIKKKFKKKTPLLGGIPIIKMFFSNESTNNRQKDLVLFITPKVPSFEKDLVKAEYRFQSLRELLAD